MEGKRTRGRPRLRWKDSVRRYLQAWKIRANGLLTDGSGNVSARSATPHRERAAKDEHTTL